MFVAGSEMETFFKERQEKRSQVDCRKVIETSHSLQSGSEGSCYSALLKWFLSVGLVVSDLLVLPEEPEICIFM